VSNDALDPATMHAQKTTSMVGLVMARVIVPLWVLMGASAKLYASSPRLLPKNMLRNLEAMDINLHTALAVFIAVEFAAVGLMVFKPRLARPTAAFMLASFCLVLLWEMLNGNFTDCGCLATISPPPWAMLLVDGLLLLGVCTCRVKQVAEPNARAGWALASLVAVAMGAWTFMRVPADTVVVSLPIKSDTQIEDDTPALNLETGDPVAAPVTALPAYYLPDPTEWAGMPVADIDLLRWTTGLPDLSKGKHYVIYYSRVCDHCHELLLAQFEFDLPAPTVLVAMPESPDGFAMEGLMKNPCTDCALLELPVGVDWLMSPPLVIAIEDGIVHCAKEGEDAWEPECLPWHGF